MNQAQILEYARTCLILVLRLSLLPILVATVIGILVSLLQALTQIQEQTLGFAVKLIAISVTLLACASWMGSQLLLYTQDIFNHFALLR
ncbi:MAG: type III secretion system export apparatus subunit SctS [Kiritimatiellae bacterium]|jgi:type III secretion HrpO family protein|nr:type III secretion system export apparatus subunit SctS [Kiritimatiellia bacterium]